MIWLWCASARVSSEAHALAQYTHMHLKCKFRIWWPPLATGGGFYWPGASWVRRKPTFNYSIKVDAAVIAAQGMIKVGGATFAPIVGCGDAHTAFCVFVLPSINFGLMRERSRLCWLILYIILWFLWANAPPAFPFLEMHTSHTQESSRISAKSALIPHLIHVTLIHKGSLAVKSPALEFMTRGAFFELN